MVRMIIVRIIAIDRSVVGERRHRPRQFKINIDGFTQISLTYDWDHDSGVASATSVSFKFLCELLLGGRSSAQDDSEDPTSILRVLGDFQTRAMRTTF